MKVNRRRRPPGPARKSPLGRDAFDGAGTASRDGSFTVVVESFEVLKGGLLIFY